MVAGGGAVSVGGGAAGSEAAIRAVVKVHFVLGMAAAAFALCVATLPPQLKQQGGDCAATAQDAVGMRTDALLLLLVSAGAHVVAAAVAAFALEACRLGLAWTFTVFTHGLSVRTGIHLFFALAAAAGSCPGHLDGHAAYLITDFVLLFIPLCVFFLLGLCALVPW